MYTYLRVRVRLLGAVPQTWTLSQQNHSHPLKFPWSAQRGWLHQDAPNHSFHLVHSHARQTWNARLLSSHVMVVELIFSVIWWAFALAERHPTDLATGHCLYQFPSKQARFVRFRVEYPFRFWSKVSKVTRSLELFSSAADSLLPPAPSVCAHANITWHRRRDTMVVFLKHYNAYAAHISWWQLSWNCNLQIEARRPFPSTESSPRKSAPQHLSHAHTVIGHSMSKGIKKKDEQNLHRLLLAVAFNYIN